MTSTFLKRCAAGAFAALAVMSAAQAANGSYVGYTATPLGDSLWRYDYTITNISPALSFDEVTLYFATNDFTSIVSAQAPGNWDAVTAQPGGPWWAGFVDVLKLDGPLAQGESATGFSVIAQYAGSGTPGAQPFELLDSSTYTSLQWGWTEQAVAAPVPEPASFLLCAAGLAAVLAARRRRASAA